MRAQDQPWDVQVFLDGNWVPVKHQQKHAAKQYMEALQKRSPKEQFRVVAYVVDESKEP